MSRPTLFAALPLLAGLAACEHAQPFGVPAAEPNQPFSSAFPRLLTFSAGPALQPAWLPDGSGIIYSYSLLRADNDRCLGILPAEGGHLLRTICHTPLDDADSTNALLDPAVGPGGSLAYVRESSRPGALAPASRELVVASLAAPDPGRALVRLPYAASDGALQGTARSLRWADATTLYYLAEQVGYNTQSSPFDTSYSPIEIVRLILAGDSAIVSPVPGTQGVTSFALVGSDTAYVTLPRDSAVYALALASGARTVVHVFRAVGAVIDGQRQGGRLFVVAGFARGRGLGGDAYVLDAAADTVVALNPQDFVWYQHAAVSPSGERVATEGYSVVHQYVCETCPTDTIVGRLSTLWLLKAP